MFRGFNLKLVNVNIREYYNSGIELYAENKRIVRKTLKSFVNDDGSLDASKMKKNWFPQIKTNVFISHSRKDEKLAISLAGWLNDVFKLTSFVDSCIWGYADELLKMIDDEYCLNEGRETYSYQRRNFSTSHIHMMLSTALSMMIDNTECILFLNTPNSITPYDVITNKEGTFSPWIYSEIAMTQLIRKKTTDEHRGILKRSATDFSESRQLKIKYDLDLSHLIFIDSDTLNNWGKKNETGYYEYPLDCLYDICPVI